ncbi:uncharacterized protein [Procambarus clarkii]|uniref:uncharacterized protein isoform X1 n=1 Tax=Procambarus clarkii TaxID=6728 RepID=UPI0037424ACC
MRRPGLVSCGSGLTTQFQFLRSADPGNCERCQRSPWGPSLSTSLSARGTPHQPHVSRQQHLLNHSPAKGLGQYHLPSSSRQHLHLSSRSHDEALAALSSVVCDCCCGNNISAHTLCWSRPGTAVREVESVYPRQLSPYLVLCCSSCESPPGGTPWCYPASEVAVEGLSYPEPTAGDD